MNLNSIPKETEALNQVSDWLDANVGLAILLNLAAEREDGPARPELKLLANLCKEAFDELGATLKAVQEEPQRKEPGALIS
jgi:hypothetical protein